MKKLLLVLIVLNILSCTKKEIELTSPIINITEVSFTNDSTVKTGGNISSDGNSPITLRGIVWDLSPNPTIILNTKTNDGSGVGSFISTIPNLKPATKYFLRAYATNIIGTSYSNELTFLTKSGLPVITTSNVIFTTNSSFSGGVVISDGGSVITAKGIVYSTSTSPTIALNTKTNDGNGNSNFNSTILNLLPNTKYFLRAYATNSNGTSYGNEITFATISNILTDIDGNFYNVVSIGKQVWMSENLKTSKYQNGDLIPEVQSASNWMSQKNGAFVYYNNNIFNNLKFGKLYNWYAATDARNACPINWHVPSNEEWTNLSNYLGGIDSAGAKLKEIGTSLWLSPNIANNQSGFSALPNGCRCNDSGAFGGGPQPPNQGMGAVFWTTNEISPGSNLSILRQINHNSPKLDSGSNFKYYGFGIRCIRN